MKEKKIDHRWKKFDFWPILSIHRLKIIFSYDNHRSNRCFLPSVDYRYRSNRCFFTIGAQLWLGTLKKACWLGCWLPATSGGSCCCCSMSSMKVKEGWCGVTNIKESAQHRFWVKTDFISSQNYKSKHRSPIILLVDFSATRSCVDILHKY